MAHSSMFLYFFHRLVTPCSYLIGAPSLHLYCFFFFYKKCLYSPCYCSMACQLHIMRVKSYIHASFCCNHTIIRLHVQICSTTQPCNIQYVQLTLSKCSYFPLKRIRHAPKGMAMNYANINTLIRNHFPSSVQYVVGSSAQLCQSSQGHNLCTLECATFLVSTYAELCHVTWQHDNPDALPG